MRATLKMATPTDDFNSLLKQIMALNVKQRHASRLECQKMQLEPALTLICHEAQIERQRLDALDKILTELPRATEHEYVLNFVSKFKDLAASLPGNLTPPLTNWVRKDEMAQLAMGCMLLHTTPLELIGVAWLRAGRESPQIFEKGCADPTAHEQSIADLRQRIDQLVITAADLLTFDDLRIEFHDAGNASVTYTLSNGEVPASGPGDPRGIPALIKWMEENAT